MAPGNGIGVDPQQVRAVAQQCMGISNDLQTQAGQIAQQMATLQGSLTGSTASQFEEQFQTWKQSVQNMSQLLQNVNATLNQVATDAENALAAIRAGIAG